MAGTTALLTRSLRTDAKLMRTHIVRFAFATFAWLAAVNVQQVGRASAPGLFFFQQIVWLNFAFVTGAGSYLAGVITEEKEERMLGLLRLAGVDAVSFLLGKTAPRLLTIALLLSVQLPSRCSRSRWAVWRSGRCSPPTARSWPTWS